MGELLPCPFCGGSGKIVEYNGGIGEVRCTTWACSVVFVSDSIERSIERWNRRTPPPATAKMMLGTWFKTSAQGPEPVLYIPERLIVAMRAEWSETQGEDKP